MQQPKSGRPWRNDWAFHYLNHKYGDELGQAYRQLEASFGRFFPSLTLIPAENLVLIVCFDEASHLCNTSAVTGTDIKAAKDENVLIDPVEVESHSIAYSNFQAMRRALRYLRQAEPKPPRVFGLFADTSSRFTNFQTRASEDDSARSTVLPVPGSKQFQPIYLFTSIDAHSSLLAENHAIPDPEKVAEVGRLLKFGRAGWYSLYTAKSKSSPDEESYTKDSIVKFAQSKVLCLKDPQQLSSDLTRKNRLRFLAVLSIRLALNIGPFSLEAGEVISSHLAVLLRTDEDRHFLRTYYPSEPILAERRPRSSRKLVGIRFCKPCATT